MLKWLNKIKEKKYNKRVQEFNGWYDKVPGGFVDIKPDTPTAFIALNNYKWCIKQQIAIRELQKQLSAQLSIINNLNRQVFHLQEEVARLDGENEERKAKEVEMD